MNQDLVDEFTQRLRQARVELYRTIAQTDEELATLEAHQAGAPVEDAAGELIAVLLSQLEGREKHELDEIAAAQTRLAAGSYGVCEGCGMPIPLPRLRALPAARQCMPCQLKHGR
jgi:RNA polymerase-binding protein DksA